VRTIDKKRISIKCSTSFENITDLNSNFALASMKVAYVGQNRNLSDIPKEVIEDAIPSMYNCPIVGRYIRDVDDFGGHDCELITDKDNQIKLINATTPFGVVPESATYHFEKIADDNNVIHDYFIIDKVILWKRQEGFDCIKSNKNIGQSMEVDFLKYHVDDNNYLAADEIEFAAFCLLGKDVEPCFEGASVQVFANSNDYQKQFILMCNELKQFSQEQLKNVSIASNGNKEGGNLTVKLTQEQITSILNEFNLKLNQLDFEITDDMTEKDLKTKLSKFSSTQARINKFVATYNEKRRALDNACEPSIERDANGDFVSSTYYWVCDFDDKHVYVEKSFYSDNNDETTYGRFAYTFDDSTKTATLTSDFELMIRKWLTVEENNQIEKARETLDSIQSDFEQYKKDYSTANADVDKLKEFKEKTLESQRSESEKAIFSQFDEQLKDNKDFAALKLDSSKYSVSELEDKCFALCGRQQFSIKPSNRVLINKNINTDTDEPYGGICSGK